MDPTDSIPPASSKIPALIVSAPVGFLKLIASDDSYDPAKTLKQNLLTYYVQMSRRRFHLYWQLSDGQSDRCTFSTPAECAPSQITVQSRKTIAGHVRSFAAPMALMTYLSQLSGDQSNLVVSIFELDSPEMNLVVDYFAGFLERGLALEN